MHMFLILAFLYIGFSAAGTRAESFSNPNDFLGRGTPTFVVGTLGDLRADRCVAGQVELIRGMIFPDATVIEDVRVNVREGPGAWPANTVVYGGPHVNDVMRAIDGGLPFEMSAGRLIIGGEAFEGVEYRLITVVPRREPDAKHPGYPEFLLYAGTAMPGVGEINAVRHGGSPILVADSFGPLMTGTWVRNSDGGVDAVFTGAHGRRTLWRMGATVDDGGWHVRHFFPEQLPAAKDEAKVVDACARGIARGIDALHVSGGGVIRVYIYPDRGSIRSLTGVDGDGHAVVAANTLHVVRYDPSDNGPLESLIAHEGAHLLTYSEWGPAGSALMGEGTAVWASGQYGGRSLVDWAGTGALPSVPLPDLLADGFRKMKENESYPFAGLFVERLVSEFGLDVVRDYLYGAGPNGWNDACAAAGVDADEIERLAGEIASGGREGGGN